MSQPAAPARAALPRSVLRAMSPAALRRRASGAPLVLSLVAAAVAVVVCCPLVFVVMQAGQSGWDSVRRLLGRPLVTTLLWHTLELTVTVTAATLLIGFCAAFLTQRTDIPGRRVFTVLLAMPLAVPEFVHGYCWVSLFPSVQGFWGAVLVMTTSLYPLVFLPVAATLRRSDAATEEVARSLGHSRWRVLWRVTLPQTRPALAGGALLVSLYLLGEYGAFAMVRYTTFATAIYTQFETSFDTVSASVLALVLIVLAVLVTGAEAGAGRRRGRGVRVVREGAAARPADPLALGRGRIPALLGLAAVVGTTLGVPVYALGYWLAKGNSSTLPSASIWTATATTAGYALVTAAVATAAAVPVALLAWRHPGHASEGIVRLAYLTRALPGIAVALAVVFFAIRYAQPWYQQPPMLVAGYVVLFFPLALTAVRASLAHVPHGVEDVARSLGRRRLAVLGRVTLPLIAPGLAASFAMVALTASTELTATLLLHPTGTETLATRFWSYTTGLAYGAAAPYAAMMTVLSVPAVVLLTRRTLGPARSLKEEA